MLMLHYSHRVKTKMSLANRFNPVWASNEDRAHCVKVKGLLSSYDHSDN